MQHLLKVLEGLKGPLLEKAQSQGWLTDKGWQYQTRSPSMGALVVNQDKAPLPTQQIVQELKEIVPLLSVPHMIHRFHPNRAMKETSDKVSAFQLEISGRTVARRDHTKYGTPWRYSPIGAADHRHPTSKRFISPLTGSRARAEIDQQLVRLRPLNSSSTCYMNATILAWIHATNRLACNDRLAYGSKTHSQLPFVDCLSRLVLF